MTQNQVLINQVHIKVNGSDLSGPALTQLLEVEVDSSFNMPATAVLRFHDDDLALVGADTFGIGKEVEIRFPNAQKALTTVFTGPVTTLEPEFGDDFRSIFVVRCHDKLQKLHRGRSSKVFQNSSYSDVVTATAREAGLRVEVDSTSVVLDHLMRQDQSDFEFIASIARRTGFLFKFKDDQLLFKAAQSFSEGECALKWGMELREFRPRFGVGGSVSEVSVHGWDYQNKAAVLGTATSIANAPMADVGFGAAAPKAQSLWSASGKAHFTETPGKQALADTLAQATLDRVTSGAMTAEGTSFGNAALMAGSKVSISNLTSVLNGTYFVTRVRHRYSRDGYDTDFWCGEFGSGTFASLITDDPRSLNSFSNQPMGLIRAIVTNIEDPESLGRVKLKFPTMNDEAESFWATMVSAGAGDQRGFLVLPEVNDEVLVGFAGGDVNQPFVLGGLWNGRDNPPENNAVQNGKVEIREFKTRFGHVLRFTDKSGEEKIELMDKAGSNLLEIDSANNTISIKSGKDIILDAVGDIKLKGVNIKIEGSAKVQINGPMVQAEGQTQIQLKGGMAELSASGITKVSGSMVNIN